MDISQLKNRLPGASDRDLMEFAKLIDYTPEDVHMIGGDGAIFLSLDVVGLFEKLKQDGRNLSMFLGESDGAGDRVDIDALVGLFPSLKRDEIKQGLEALGISPIASQGVRSLYDTKTAVEGLKKLYADLRDARQRAAMQAILDAAAKAETVANLSMDDASPNPWLRGHASAGDVGASRRPNPFLE
jgi:hypothetical protein